MPISHQQYIHRIGRTGRIGKSGSSILLVTNWEKEHLFNRIFSKEEIFTEMQSANKKEDFTNLKEKLITYARGLPDDGLDKAYVSQLGCLKNFGLKKAILESGITNINKLYTDGMGRLSKPKVSKQQASKMNLLKFSVLDYQ